MIGRMQRLVRTSSIMLGLLLVTTFVGAQHIILEGKVRDANTHREISGVNIIVPELGVGTFSNTAGRFTLTVVKPEPAMIVYFQHVSYDTLELTIEEVITQENFDLQERLILVPTVEVAGYDNSLEFVDDFSSAVTVIEANGFDVSGFLDAGDLLRTDHSIQVDEELTGKKTAVIRGGTSDEVIVLYNGIKMNNVLDNTFDLSLIDLNDIERFEVIKGSNTSLYGPEGFSGVINIVPRVQPDYSFRLRQQLGSRETSNTGVSAYRQFGKVHASYSLKRGGFTREYSDAEETPSRLENDNEHHNLSLLYTLSETQSGKPKSSIGMMFVKTDLDYDNQRFHESLSNRNQMASLRFNGNLGDITNMNLSAAYQWSDDQEVLGFYDQPTDSGFIDRVIETSTIHLNADRTIFLPYTQVMLGYQFKNSGLKFQDDRLTATEQPLVLDQTSIERQNHGFVGVFKFKSPFNHRQFGNLNLDLSARYDVVRDRLDEDGPFSDVPTSAEVQDSTGSLVDNTWREGMVNVSLHAAGTNGKTAYRSFLNAGINLKFPTLLQQINTPELLSSNINRPSIRPERNRSVEAGFEIARETRQISGLFGWQTRLNVFRNEYENKLRTYFLPGTPVAIYDNVKDAALNGVEARQTVYLFNKKFTVDFGFSRYFFSDPARFSYTPDRKYTAGVSIIQSGYALKLNAFHEGEQIGQIRDRNGGFTNELIPTTTNLDLHFSKTFRFRESRILLNGSVRNMLDDDFQLEGLSIRDRRFYITMGLEF